MKMPKLARKNIDQRLLKLQPIEQYTHPPRGWIQAIREALGMTTAQFAARLGVSQPRIMKLEDAERRKAVTLDTLERAARALDCTLVYAIIPNSSLEDMVRKQAEKVAKRRLESVSHTMRLEKQGVSKAVLQEQYNTILSDLLNGLDRKLWDE